MEGWGERIEKGGGGGIDRRGNEGCGEGRERGRRRDRWRKGWISEANIPLCVLVYLKCCYSLSIYAHKHAYMHIDARAHTHTHTHTHMYYLWPVLSSL